jgi:hypothetical protein
MTDQDAPMIDSADFTEAEIAAARAWRAQQIAAFEAQFGMSSEEFLKRWREDTIEDSVETNYWANLLINWE